ncbi:hypothetical protein D3C86_1642390 [compost metagenome]
MLTLYRYETEVLQNRFTDFLRIHVDLITRPGQEANFFTDLTQAAAHGAEIRRRAIVDPLVATVRQLVDVGVEVNGFSMTTETEGVVVQQPVFRAGTALVDCHLHFTVVIEHDRSGVEDDLAHSFGQIDCRPTHTDVTDIHVHHQVPDLVRIIEGSRTGHVRNQVRKDVVWQIAERHFVTLLLYEWLYFGGFELH